MGRAFQWANSDVKDRIYERLVDPRGQFRVLCHPTRGQRFLSARSPSLHDVLQVATPAIHDGAPIRKKRQFCRRARALGMAAILDRHVTGTSHRPAGADTGVGDTAL